MSQPKTWDDGFWDTGVWDPDLAPIVNKIMKAKFAANLTNLDNRAKLAKFQTPITKCTGNASIGTPTNPPLADCQQAHDAAKTKLDEIDAKEEELKALRIVRDQLMDDAMNKYCTLGSFAESKANGNPAVITGAGFDLVSDRTTPPPVSKIMNLVLTHGDHDGTVDAAWNRDTSAASYEVQTSLQVDSGWTFYKSTSISSITIKGLTSGTRIWVRVRSTDKDEPGEWSDPVSMIVP